MRRLTGRLARALGFALGAAVASCGGRRSGAGADAFTRAVTSYLEKKGTLCLGKSAWPIDVDARDLQLHARDAVQMPVLERLGLVTSSAETVDVPADEESPATRRQVRRYRLTDAGAKYFLPTGSDGRRDLCAAKLDLDKVVSWELAGDAAAPQATVKYTYRVAAFPWTNDAEAQEVFPAVTRVIRGAGTAQLVETFTKTGEGWVADDLRGASR